MSYYYESPPGPLLSLGSPTIPMRFYVPSVRADGIACEHSVIKSWVRALARFCCDAGGGCTVTKGMGHWIHDTGALQTEAVMVVYCALSEPLDAHQQAEAVDLCQTMALALGQACVAVEYAGRLAIVEPKAREVAL